MTAGATAFVAGLFNLAFAAFHIAFWHLFGWPARLKGLDAVNRPLLPLMNICLIILFAGLGIALVGAPQQAATTELGRLLMSVLSVFWLARAAMQPIFYPLRHPASMALLVLFAVGAILHGLALVLPGTG